MLPDFPELKKRLLTIIKVTFHQKVREDGLIGAIRETPYFEGNRFENKDVEGESETSSPKLMAIPISVERAAIIEHGVDAYAKVMMEAVAVQQQQLSQMFRDKMDEVTEKTGNRVNAGGRPLSADLFLDMLEKVEIDFTDEGEPDFSAVRIVLSPEMGKHLQKFGPEWEADPAFKKRHSEIIDKKRAIWRDRESNRKLVD